MGAAGLVIVLHLLMPGEHSTDTRTENNPRPVHLQVFPDRNPNPCTPYRPSDAQLREQIHPVRFLAFKVIQWIKFFSSAAIRVSYLYASKRVIMPTPIFLRRIIPVFFDVQPDRRNRPHSGNDDPTVFWYSLYPIESSSYGYPLYISCYAIVIFLYLSDS